MRPLQLWRSDTGLRFCAEQHVTNTRSNTHHLKTIPEIFAAAIPQRAIRSAVEFGRRHVRLPSSARSSRFDPDITPWIREPLEAAGSGAYRVVTFVKPVQCGGSVAGEVLLAFWLSQETHGEIQYNWEDNKKAIDRWDRRFERILTSCKPVMARAPDRTKSRGLWNKGEVYFPHASFWMQGVTEGKNLDSDSIRFQVNEEIHNWEPGRLAKAFNRTTAVWDAISFNISNAGKKGGQLDLVFRAGTQQVWQVPCPTCGKLHAMRTFFDARKPHLGGLRYDADGCRLEDDGYDYARLEKTIRYQFPCGHEMRDDPAARRKMSMQGHYSKPRNQGALKGHASFTLEAVSIDYIRWLTLIQDKHEALRALKYGDPEPWWRYLAERECRFYNPDDDRPVVGKIVLSQALKKDRDGLGNRVARFAALDRQKGQWSKGQAEHWWCVIRDVDERGNSRLVFEGMLMTDGDVVETLQRHNVAPSSVVVDSGDYATRVYHFCLKHGYNAIKGSAQNSFSHGDEGHKIFSPERPLYQMVNAQPTKDNPNDEPLFWLYSKSGIRERLHWLRGCGQFSWEVPGDVSSDYQDHMESEEMRTRKHPRTRETVTEWVQVRERNDLYVCECYIAMLMEMADLIQPPETNAPGSSQDPGAADGGGVVKA